jgi:hypothetical protein
MWLAPSERVLNLSRVLPCVLCGAFVVSACHRSSSSEQTPAPSPAAGAAAPATSPAAHAQPVQVEMKNLHLHLDDDLVVEVRHLRGEMISRKPGEPPIFDDSTSYVIEVSDAEIAIDVVNLSNLMNRHVFGQEGSPLSNVTVSVGKDGRLEQKGKIHKGIALPFSMKATVDASEDGRMRLKADSIKVAGVPSKGLMDFVGLSLEDVVKLKNQRGIEVVDDTLLIAPGQILPPPEIRGRVTTVAVSGNALVQRIASTKGEKTAAPLSPPDPHAKNYLYFSGGVLRFGKLTMHDADLQLIDADPSNPFDFYPKKYLTQLTAGYSITTPTGGLKTTMPDYQAAVKGKKPAAPLRRRP